MTGIRKFCALPLGLALSLSAYADNEFYCGTHIISEGLSKQDVLQRCGPPASRFYDHWVYNRGPEHPKILLHFDGEQKVERIEQEQGDDK